MYTLVILITGKLGIDLERKLVIHGDRDKDVWSSPKVDPSDLAEARRYAAPERKVSRLKKSFPLEGKKMSEYRLNNVKIWHFQPNFE